MRVGRRVNMIVLVEVASGRSKKGAVIAGGTSVDQVDMSGLLIQFHSLETAVLVLVLIWGSIVFMVVRACQSKASELTSSTALENAVLTYALARKRLVTLRVGVKKCMMREVRVCAWLKECGELKGLTFVK